MALRFETRRMGRIQEERDFTNPAVRFVTIRGKVVPIVNKKRMGELTDKVAGKSLLAGGTLLGAAAAIKGIKSAGRAIGRKKPVKFATHSALGKAIGSFVKKDFAQARRKTSILKKLNTKTRGVSGVAIKATATPIKFVARHPGKLGLAALALGGAGKILGAELQAKSSLGYDILAEKK